MKIVLVASVAILSMSLILSPIATIHAQENDIVSATETTKLKAPLLTVPQGIHALKGQSLQEIILPDGYGVIAVHLLVKKH